MASGATARSLMQAAAALLLIAAVGFGQRGRFGVRDDEEEAPLPKRDADFHFLRLEYTDLPEYHRRWGYASRAGLGSGWWVVDWPAADNHFTAGIARLTRVDTGDPRHLSLEDNRIFDYPWIYATQTGWWGLSPREIERLREYLLRGGYLVADDFWGAEQWEVFRETMNRTLPGEPIADLDEADPVMHVVYDIGKKDQTFIPGSRHLRQRGDGTAQVVQPPGTQPAWRAMRDAKGHAVVAANFNTDVGDAWEFADVPYYPAEMTTLAYRYGVNYVVYAMTH